MPVCIIKPFKLIQKPSANSLMSELETILHKDVPNCQLGISRNGPYIGGLCVVYFLIEFQIFL